MDNDTETDAGTLERRKGALFVPADLTNEIL